MPPPCQTLPLKFVASGWIQITPIEQARTVGKGVYVDWYFWMTYPVYVEILPTEEEALKILNTYHKVCRELGPDRGVGQEPIGVIEVHCILKLHAD
jgi:hypothetical protein